MINEAMASHQIRCLSVSLEICDLKDGFWRVIYSELE